MNIMLNHSRYELNDGTPVTSLIQALALAPNGIAIAINHTIIPPSDWHLHELKEHDVVDIFNVVAGG